MSELDPQETPEVLPVTPVDAVEIPLADVSGAGPDLVEVRVGAFGVHGSPDVSGYGGLINKIEIAGASERPYGSYFDEVADDLAINLGSDYNEAIEKVVVDRGEVTFYVRRARIVEVCQAMLHDPLLRFEMCLGVSGVHWPNELDRELHAVYHLRSITHNRIVRLEVTCPDSDPHVPSTTSVYPTNDWHERETYDFFGIVFDGHPYLTRIEMPDDWLGHPQRKDYPLGGIPVEYKGATVPPPDKRRSYS